MLGNALRHSPAGRPPLLSGSTFRRAGELRGGTLEAENTPGGGLTMVLSLPAAPASRPRAMAEEVAGS